MFAAIFSKFEDKIIKQTVLNELIPIYVNKFDKIPAHLIRACLLLNETKCLTIILKNEIDWTCDIFMKEMVDQFP